MCDGMEGGGWFQEHGRHQGQRRAINHKDSAGITARVGNFIRNQFRLRRSEAFPSLAQDGEVGRREGRFKEL